MLKFSLSKTIRDKMIQHHRAVQTTIQELANVHIGMKPPPRVGIPKWEGGVIVNQREICIKRDFVVDDFGPSQSMTSSFSIEPTREEEAVVWAIGEVARIVKENPSGLTPPPNILADPLHALLDI